jgi:hypothetical protein
MGTDARDSNPKLRPRVRSQRSTHGGETALPRFAQAYENAAVEVLSIRPRLGTERVPNAPENPGEAP